MDIDSVRVIFVQFQYFQLPGPGFALMDLSKKRIMLTGGAGFLGAFVAQKLKARGCKHIFIPKEQHYDLTKAEAIERAFKDSKAEVVIHLAAKVGGIGANRENPGSFFYDNPTLTPVPF